MSRKCPTCATSFPDEVFFCGYDGTITVEEQPAGDVDPRLGQQLGGYIVVARVADGAMGRVYEGRHPETKTRVAIKVLHADVARDAVAVERFRREYDTASEIANPHIVKVLEFGETPDRSHFLTMEYLVGEELSHRIARQRGQPLEDAVRIVCQMALALDHAHSFGVIHRDLKPGNIYLCREDAGDSVRLLDFGSVKLQVDTGPKLTAFGTTLGSPYYMSPEQAMGKSDVDQRTDVFALTAILFEMLTGRICFEGGNVAEILMKIVSAAPPTLGSVMPSAPRVLEPVIAKGLARDPSNRYSSAGELARAVLSALGLEPTVAKWAETPPDAIGQQVAAVGAVAGQPDVGTMPAAAQVPGPARRGPRLPADGGTESLRPSASRAPLLVIGVGVGLVAMVAVVALVRLMF